MSETVEHDAIEFYLCWTQTCKSKSCRCYDVLYVFVSFSVCGHLLSVMELVDQYHTLDAVICNIKDKCQHQLHNQQQSTIIIKVGLVNSSLDVFTCFAETGWFNSSLGYNSQRDKFVIRLLLKLNISNHQIKWGIKLWYKQHNKFVDMVETVQTIKFLLSLTICLLYRYAF